MHPQNEKHRGVEQLVARQAHNLEVARSNPASATTEARRQLGFVRFAETIDPMLCFFTGSAYGLKIIRKLNKKLSRRICMPMICLILKEIFL